MDTTKPIDNLPSTYKVEILNKTLGNSGANKRFPDLLISQYIPLHFSFSMLRVNNRNEESISIQLRRFISV